MSRNEDTPSIDSLLKTTQWEERVAQARIKREKVLAAKEHDKLNAVAEEKAQVVFRNTHASSRRAQPARHPRRQRKGRIRTVLAMIGCAALGGGAVWAIMVLTA